jgi:tetratricopeptide (TPR) repeat protein
VIFATKALNFQAGGNLENAAREIGKITENVDDPLVFLAKALQFMYQRQFDSAIQVVEASVAKLPDPRTITFLGQCQALGGKTAEATASFKRVISMMAAAVPIDARQLPSYLAYAYAGLGDKEKALDQARRAVAPYDNDILAKPFAETVLAQIQGKFGDLDGAIAAIPHLLEVPNGITRANLRLDPQWDPLRKDPRFQKLCQEQQP